MKSLPLKYPSIEVSPENPFEHDEFEREKLVEPLTQILDTVDHPFVFAVTAPWGTGKTTFVKQWAAHLLESEKWSVIQFNAWENDFSDSALATMIAELTREVNAIERRHSGPIKTAARAVSKAGAAMARTLIPAGVKAVTFGALNVDDELKKVVTKVIETPQIDIIKHYEESKKSIEDFKVAIGKLVSSLAKADSPTKLVIFVDELDRCRPNFALEMLEVMKHLFDVRGVIFVLAVDMNQLQGSVASVYGSTINAKEYLRRFIDMPFALPMPPAESLVKHLWNQAGLDEFVEKRHGYSGATRDLEALQSSLEAFAKLFPECVRFHEHIMARLSAVLRTLKTNSFAYGEVLVFLLYLRDKWPDVYEQFCLKKLYPREAMDKLFDGVDASDFMASHDGKLLEASLIAALGYSREQWNETLESYYVPRAEQNPNGSDAERAHEVGRILEYIYQDHPSGDWLHYLVPKIELTDQFVDQGEPE